MSLRPLNHRDYLTTGEMARVIGCAQQTVIRQIDAGRIPAHRMPGTSERQRRCLKVAFRKYLAEHGIPADGLDEMERRAAFAEVFTSGGRGRG